MGAAGTVTVVDRVPFRSLQFSTDGYVLTAAHGGALVPDGFAQIVVDGGLAAAIAVPIMGAGGFEKSGLGALILTGQNTYRGSTTITAGTLQIGDGGTTGSIIGRVLDRATLAFDRANAITFSGSIVGGGVVEQIGSGSLALTHKNFYSGGTMLSAGTLAIGNDRALGTGPLSMAAGTTLSFLKTGDFTISNPIAIAGAARFSATARTTQTLSGVIADGAARGTLAMTGAGTLVLSATETYTGPTNVNSGTLDVTGSIASSSLTTIASGATLTGSGAFGAVLVGSGATYAPRASANVFGKLAFNGGATYQVKVSPSVASSAKVSGAALLAGSASAVFGSGAYVTKQYTILTATRGLSGTTFATLANINLPAGFTDSLSYDADDVYLNLKAGAPGRTTRSPIRPATW